MRTVRFTRFVIALLTLAVLTQTPTTALSTSCLAVIAIYPTGTTCSTLPLGGSWVPLGPLGFLYYGPQGTPLPLPNHCSALPSVSGSDDMLVYTHPGAAPPDWPCRSGSCLTPLHDVQGSWSAIVDFEGWHGESVAGTLAEAAGTSTEVALLPLDPPAIKGCPGITDLDVALALAELLEATLGPSAIPPPRVINMSFGRLLEMGEPTTHLCSIDPDGVSCLIAKLVSQLIEPTLGEPIGAVVVAAAGNHRKSLFPAALDDVLSVGALDLSVFARTRDAVTSWETEQDPLVSELDGLMPGAGLCMQLDSGGTLPLPGGSSFSSAILSGWLMELTETQPAVVQQHLAIDDPWVPYQPVDDPQSEIFLRHAGVTFSTPGSGAGELVRKALYDDLSTCGAVGPQAVTLSVPISPATTSPLHQLSFPERLEASLHDEAPASDPCSACSLCQLDVPEPPGSVTALRAAHRVAPKVASNHDLVPVFLEIDLHATWALERGTTIQEIFLRFGDEYSKLHLTNDELAMFAKGHVAYLSVKGKMIRPDLRRQPSMVMVMTLEPPLVPMPVVFWDSAPIVVRLP